MARETAKKGRIRVGVGGWTYEPWRGTFYPEGLPHARELAHAAACLGSIEVNGTFYRTQTPATFEKWYAQTPEDFVFALKAPRYAVSAKRLADAGESITRFLESGLDRLEDKLGPLNWQLAPTRPFDRQDIDAFLKLLPPRLGKRPLRHAIEVRHPSFASDAFVRLARRHGVAIVLADDSDYPRIDSDTAAFTYARLMGTTTGERLGYAPADLDRQAADAMRRAERGDVFLYVISGYKAANPAAAQALIERLS